MRHFILILIICSATSPVSALCPPDGPPCWEITLTADPACTTCNLDVPLFQQRTFYVMAGSNHSIGLLGAEFRVTGLPADWISTSTASEFASHTSGDPLGMGCNIAFSATQLGDCIQLYRVDVIATSEVMDVVLTVAPRDPPSNPSFDCPRVAYSCPPCSASCALGGTMFINASKDCTVGITPGTWSAVKSMYSE